MTNKECEEGEWNNTARSLQACVDSQNAKIMGDTGKERVPLRNSKKTN